MEDAAGALSVFALVVQVVLALAAIWYTAETRKYRLQTQTQIELLKKQYMLALFPFLRVKPIEKSIEISGSQRLVYHCELTNYAAVAAKNVEGIVFDVVTKNYFVSRGGVSLLGPRKDREDTDTLEFELGPFDRKAALEELKKSYGDAKEFLELGVSESNDSSMFVIFRTVDDTVYGWKAGLYKDDRGVLRLIKPHYLGLSALP